MVPKNYALIINHSNFISGQGERPWCAKAKQRCIRFDNITKDVCQKNSKQLCDSKKKNFYKKSCVSLLRSCWPQTVVWGQLYELKNWSFLLLLVSKFDFISCLRLNVEAANKDLREDRDRRMSGTAKHVSGGTFWRGQMMFGKGQMAFWMGCQTETIPRL